MPLCFNPRKFGPAAVVNPPANHRYSRRLTVDQHLFADRNRAATTYFQIPDRTIFDLYINPRCRNFEGTSPIVFPL